MPGSQSRFRRTSGPPPVPWPAVALAYVGTIVGAGFASGQEVLQFFGLLGRTGVYAIALSTAGFGVFGYLIMYLGRARQAGSHLPVIRSAMGRLLTPFIDFVMTFFLFGATCTMFAGAGSLVRQEFGFPWGWGASLMAAATALTVTFGLRGVVSSLSIVAPFLIGGILVVGTKVALTRGISIPAPPAGYRAVLPGWFLSGAAYVSYNIVMAVPVLATIATRATGDSDLRKSSIAGALGLGLCLVVSFFALVSSFPESVGYEIPMARLAETIHPLGKVIYSGIFLLEVYTTAVANLFGFVSRLRPEGTRPFPVLGVLTAVAALAVATTGFSRLVRSVYPVSGIAGFLFLGGLSRVAVEVSRAPRKR